MITIGIDVGTTKIAALALRDGEALACVTAPNDAGTDARGIADRAFGTLGRLVARLGARAQDVTGIGISGQQHGVVLVDRRNRPLTPFFSWQDSASSEEAARRVGKAGERRAGCRLRPGFMGTTLFRLGRQGALPRGALACFIGDFVGVRLTGGRPVTDPTQAASSGIFDVRRRRWDEGSREALDLPRSLFPECREATESRAGLLRSVARELGLPAGLPVFGAVGDCQAAYLGAAPCGGVLVNIGTGAQVAAAVERFVHLPPMETRPLPGEGYLLVAVRPEGGHGYALLARFFRAFAPGRGPLFERMNALASKAPPGSNGLRYRPSSSSASAAFEGITSGNFSPADFARAVLEGLSETLYSDYRRIRRAVGGPLARLIGSGNGLRKNALLGNILSERFGVPLEFARIPEEAASGAALIAISGNRPCHSASKGRS